MRMNLYLIHDTNDRTMPLVASYSARAVMLAGEGAVLKFYGNDKGPNALVALHHLMPGHTVTIQED